MNQLRAYCILKGSNQFKDLKGLFLFYEVDNCILVKISISGYSVSSSKCNQPILGIHIHEGGLCTGSLENPFENALGHYNPNRCNHPYHAGDLGNLFVNMDGSAYKSMKIDCFEINDVLGKAILLHENSDDFRSQPAGDSGKRIACGIVKKMK